MDNPNLRFTDAGSGAYQACHSLVGRQRDAYIELYYHVVNRDPYSRFNLNVAREHLEAEGFDATTIDAVFKIIRQQGFATPDPDF